VHPAGGLVSGTLVNGLLHHFGHSAIELEVPEEEADQRPHASTLADKGGGRGGSGGAAFTMAEVTTADAGTALSASLRALMLSDLSGGDSDDDEGEAQGGGSRSEVGDLRDAPPPPPMAPPLATKPLGAELRLGIVRPGIVHRCEGGGGAEWRSKLETHCCSVVRIVWSCVRVIVVVNVCLRKAGPVHFGLHGGRQGSRRPRPPP
jgi:hypothetical protein